MSCALNFICTFLSYRATQRLLYCEHDSITFKIRVLLVEQELLTIPDHLSSPLRVQWGSRSLLLVFFVDLVGIALFSFFLRFMTSDYLFDIFKLLFVSTTVR